MLSVKSNQLPPLATNDKQRNSTFKDQVSNQHFTRLTPTRHITEHDGRLQDKNNIDNDNMGEAENVEKRKKKKKRKKRKTSENPSNDQKSVQMVSETEKAQHVAIVTENSEDVECIATQSKHRNVESDGNKVEVKAKEPKIINFSETVDLGGKSGLTELQTFILPNNKDMSTTPIMLGDNDNVSQNEITEKSETPKHRKKKKKKKRRTLVDENEHPDM